MDKFLNILKHKKLDNFLVLNYPIVWQSRLHYLIPFFIFYTIILWVISFLFPLNKSIIILIGYAILVMGYKIIFVDKRKRLFPFTNLINVKEYLLHLLIYVLMALPLTIVIQFYDTSFFVNQKVYNDSYEINNFKFKNEKLIYDDYNCSRSLEKEEEIFLHKVIKQFSEKKVTDLSNEDFIEIKSKYRKITMLNVIESNFKLFIVILFLIPILSILILYSRDDAIYSIYIFTLICMYFLLFKTSSSSHIIQYLENIYVSMVIFTIATLFIFSYKFINNWFISFLFLGLFLYLIIFYFSLHLSIELSVILILLLLLIITSSVKEKLIILDARPKK